MRERERKRSSSLENLRHFLVSQLNCVLLLFFRSFSFPFFIRFIFLVKRFFCRCWIFLYSPFFPLFLLISFSRVLDMFTAHFHFYVWFYISLTWSSLHLTFSIDVLCGAVWMYLCAHSDTLQVFRSRCSAYWISLACTLYLSIFCTVLGVLVCLCGEYEFRYVCVRERNVEVCHCKHTCNCTTDQMPLLSFPIFHLCLTDHNHIS